MALFVSSLEESAMGILLDTFLFFEALCSKYSVVSRCQQVVSCVFCCVRMLIIHKFCTDIEAMSGRP